MVSALVIGATVGGIYDNLFVFRTRVYAEEVDFLSEFELFICG